MQQYRYAFQGQEKDPETGMEAFQLRLWDGRIGRWLTTDPYGQFASPYLGMGNNPVSGIDPDGGWWLKFWANHKRNQAIKNGMDPSELMHSKKNGWYFNLSKTYSEFGADKNDLQTIEITPISSDKGLKGYDWNNVQAKTLNDFGKIQEALASDSNNNIPLKWAGRLVYNITDDLYVAGTQTIRHGDYGPRHLNGDGASPNEVRESGLNTVMLITPTPIKGNVKGWQNFSEVLFNKNTVATFGSTFKGTFLTKLAPATRGAVIRYSNKLLSLTHPKSFVMGSSAGIKKVSKLSKNE